MIRKGLVIGIKPEFIAEYKKTHSDVWPDILEKISESKIKNYSIFAQKDRLFAFFEYHGDVHNFRIIYATIFRKLKPSIIHYLKLNGCLQIIQNLCK